MWFRVRAKAFEQQKGEGNRIAMRRLVERGEETGLLAYLDGRAIGWVSVAPRARFPRLENSRILKPVDDRPVWSIVCLFIQKEFRRRGVSEHLLKAAVDHVKTHGGAIVEGYAVEPKRGTTADAFAYPGPVSSYLRAGFQEVARRSETRPIMRFVIR